MSITKDVDMTKLIEQIKWATTIPSKIERKNGKTIKQLKKEATINERQWGNAINGQNNNGNWTTKLGENLVRDILTLRGENPRIPKVKNGLKPDLETDDYIYEVKTKNWYVTGTAGEKVYGTWIKYQDIPELYNKPLRIVCVAKQEYDLEHAKLNYFGDNVSDKTKKILDLAKSWNIEYIKFSDLIPNSINYK
jgi:hypothetical protein